MRVGVYIRQLTTLGGGNRHALAIAEHLSRDHQVEVITHTPLSASTISRRLTLDMSRITLRFIPAQSITQLAALTEEYDLFVNALHNYYIPCHAKFGTLLIFFPSQHRLAAAARIRRTVGRLLGSWLAVEQETSGMFESEYDGRRLVRLLTRDAQMVIAPSLAPFGVTFSLHNPSTQQQEVKIRLDGSAVRDVALPPGATQSVRVDLPIQPWQSYHLRFESNEIQDVWPGSISIKPTDLSYLRLLDFQTDHPKARLFRQLFENLLPGWRDRLLHVPAENFLAEIDTYDVIWANSHFTQGWIENYWNRPSDVIYPMVEVESFRLAAKQQSILSVGRFFVAAHNKKHLVMIQAFKQLVDGGLRGWTLHLSGGVVDDPIHQRYLESVRAAASGYPIEIHSNQPFLELVDLYSRAAIYWHAAGFGEDEEREPIKMEHFGVTTVEAMASGCVPVVIRKGGQTEIVDHGRTGFLWNDLDELKEYTLRLIRDEGLCQKLGANALAESQRFDRTHFGASIDRSLRRIGAID